MAKILFFSLFLIIQLTANACEPDSTAKIITDRLIKQNEVTIVSDLSSPALYNIDLSDMWGFKKDRFRNAYLVQVPGPQRIYFWEIDGNGCRWIDADFETKFVLYQLLNKPLISTNIWLIKKTYNLK